MLFGALIPLVSVPLAAVLMVALCTVHLPYGFTSVRLKAVTAAWQGAWPYLQRSTLIPRASDE